MLAFGCILWFPPKYWEHWKVFLGCLHLPLPPGNFESVIRHRERLSSVFQLSQLAAKGLGIGVPGGIYWILEGDFQKAVLMKFRLHLPRACLKSVLVRVPSKPDRTLLSGNASDRWQGKLRPTAPLGLPVGFEIQLRLNIRRWLNASPSQRTQKRWEGPRGSKLPNES